MCIHAVRLWLSTFVDKVQRRDTREKLVKRPPSPRPSPPREGGTVARFQVIGRLLDPSSARSSQRLDTILLLLGEKAGVRVVVSSHYLDLIS